MTRVEGLDRRVFVQGVATAGLVSTAGWAAAEVSSSAGPSLPPNVRLPRFEFVYESEVKIATPLDVGNTAEGHRRIIPITGGVFRGPKLRGDVVSNGADWNLQRADGTGSVEAAYYLKTDDGVYIRITNKGVSSAGATQPSNENEQFLMYTNPTFEAPVGPYSWMNTAMFVGTLSIRPASHGSVLIRVFQLV